MPARFLLKIVKQKFAKPVVIITGATGSVGQALCKTLSSYYTIIAVGRNEQMLSELEQFSSSIKRMQFDLANSTDFQIELEKVLQLHQFSIQDVALAFLNAGSGLMKPFAKIGETELLTYLQTNLTCNIQLAHYFCKSNVPIFITASCISFVCNKNYQLYHIAKAGLRALYKGLKLENLPVFIAYPATIRESAFFESMPPRTGIRKLGNLRMLSVGIPQLIQGMFGQLALDVGEGYYGIVTYLSRLAALL